jgi:SAM-dependent MidA family methyltransferase
MPAKTIHNISPAFLAAFREQADADGTMSFARFMELALYHPGVGYYARPARRIGRDRDTDFFTATSLGPLFGELVVGACRDLLGGQAPDGFTFVEIGAEPPARSDLGSLVPCPVEGAAPSAPLGNSAATARRPPVSGGSRIASGDQPLSGSVLAGVTHPFAAPAAIALGQPLRMPPRCIVFSNELFDAQPCHRLVRTAGRWRECGVALQGDSLTEVLLPDLAAEVQTVRDRLPAVAPEGYRLDLPLAAEELAARIAAQPWAGLFVAFDYGKSWRELTEATPAGTVRTYRRHRQSNDLLAQPGEQDLTCHICWDWLSGALTAHDFAAPVLESQEAFFVNHAAPALSRLTAAEADRFSARKLGVMQLLHPGNMGQKFQVLWARREQRA